MFASGVNDAAKLIHGWSSCKLWLRRCHNHLRNLSLPTPDSKNLGTCPPRRRPAGTSTPTMTPPLPRQLPSPAKRSPNEQPEGCRHHRQSSHFLNRHVTKLPHLGSLQIEKRPTIVVWAVSAHRGGPRRERMEGEARCARGWGIVQHGRRSNCSDVRPRTFPSHPSSAASLIGPHWKMSKEQFAMWSL